MTNHWIDMKNTKLILMFSNVVENHPGSTQWLVEAKANGAKCVIVDPRRTRSAVLADIHLRIRPGTDIALINGLMKYLFDAGKDDSAYLFARTDGPYSLNASQLDYVRSGGTPTAQTTEALMKSTTATVYNYLKTRVSGYTAEVVSSICGISTNEFNMVANEIKTTCDPSLSTRKRMTILYAMGTTQHSYGSQNCRSYCLLQLVTGNMGMLGGGVNALRGIHNVQGSTDMGLLYNSIPAYSGPRGQKTTLYADVAWPAAGGSLTIQTNARAGFKTTETIYVGGVSGPRSATLDNISGTAAPFTFTLSATTGAAGNVTSGTAVYWDQSYDHYQNRLFGAPQNSTFDGYGKVGTAGTDPWRGWQQVGYKQMTYHYFRQGTAAANHNLMPIGNGYDHRTFFQKMKDGTIKCAVIFGQNPAVTEANLAEVRAGIYQVDTLVLVDCFLNETAALPRKSGGKTYVLPAASFAERPGSTTSSARWIQWRNRAILPKGNSRCDAEILLRLADRLVNTGALNHISGATYAALYGDATQSGYGWTPSGETAMTADDMDTVYHNVFKQMSSWLSTTAGDPGTIWIYGAAYGQGYVGSKLNAAPSSTTQIVVDKALVSGTDCDITSQKCPAGSLIEVGEYGSNVEFVKVSSVTVGGSTVTIDLDSSTPLANTHVAGEPVTPCGFYSYECVTRYGTSTFKVNAKSRASWDPFGNGIYPRFSFAWLVNRRNFYNYNKCNTGAPHREVAFMTNVSYRGGRTINVASTAGFLAPNTITIAGAGPYTIASVDANASTITVTTTAGMTAYASGAAVVQTSGPAASTTLSQPAGLNLCVSSTDGIGVGETVGIYTSLTVPAAPTLTTTVTAKGTGYLTLAAIPDTAIAMWVNVSEENTSKASTTVSGAHVAGATTLNLATADVTKLFAGDFLLIGSGSTQETRKVSSVTGGTPGSVVVTPALGYAHANGETVEELTTGTVGNNVASGYIGNGSRWTPDYLTWCADKCPYRPAPGGDGTCNCPADARDFFVAPDGKARLFVHYEYDSPADAPPDPEGPNTANTTSVYRYRAYSFLRDSDGRTPKHWEPWETTKTDVLATYGTTGTAPLNNYVSTKAERSEFPLTLTTFRHTEHFQGGPLTRNVDWLCELVPDAIVELNTADAGNAGVKTGDNVDILSFRAVKKTQLNGPYSSGTSLTVDSSSDFAVGDRVLVGDGVSLKLGAATPETVSGTVDSVPSSTTMVDSVLTQGDDYWNGATLVITGGTGSGQTRTVTDFVDSSNQLTISSAWTTTPDATSTYTLTLPSTVFHLSSSSGLNTTASGTADALAVGATLVDSALTQEDDYWNGATLVITGGTGSGQTRTVSDFDAASDTLTVSAAWTTQPDGTSTYTLTRSLIQPGDKILIGAGIGTEEERTVDSVGLGSDTLRVTLATGTPLVNAHSANEWVMKQEEVKAVSAVPTGTTLTLSSALKNPQADNTYVYNVSKGWIGPWKAVVGAGLQANQRVGAGVVGIPWHWGNQGLRTGPSANDLCIDAMDGLMAMPESKVALVKIRKTPS